ncbi:MAG: rhodanese-like domain-containing protein [Planctomycetaceae bacterium]
MEVDCGTVKAKRDAGDVFLLLDCREQAEFDRVAIDGAVLLPMSEIHGRVSELEEHKAAEIVVYCHHGGRSLRVAMWLRQQGFQKAFSMAGGIDQWAMEIDVSLPRY